jgi:hypothetical protein
MNPYLYQIQDHKQLLYELDNTGCPVSSVEFFQLNPRGAGPPSQSLSLSGIIPMTRSIPM